jgi:AcrR family transcriptional regulator
MAVQERAVATRASIIRGAAEIFNDRGFASASLEVIADASSVTRGALYFHFKTKEDIANAVIDEQHRISRGYAEKALAMSSTAFEGMLRMSAGLARQLTTEVVVSAGIRLTTDGTASDLSAKDPYRDWINTFETLISAGIEQGDIRAETDPVRMAKYIIPSYTGVQLVSDTLHDRRDIFDRVRDMWEFLIPALVVTSRADDAIALLDIIKRKPGRAT